MYPLEDGYASEGSEKETFQRCVKLHAQKQWTGLALGEDKCFIGLGCDYQT